MNRKRSKVDLVNRTAGFEASLLNESEVSPSDTGHESQLADTLCLKNPVFEVGQTAEQQRTLNPRAGDRIGRFQLIRRLGSGSFGEVFLARDDRLNRDVAVKIPVSGLGPVGEARKRLLREREAASRLSHSNIVPVYESDDLDGVLFMVSEYCSGPPMAAWLSEQSGPVNPRLAADIIRQLASALDHSHQQGILHRDVKPSNVLLEISDTADEFSYRPRLTDFGLARDLSGSTDDSSSGHLLGTVKYMSPEQAKGGSSSLTAASDVYSLGIVMYELLTGRVPFEGDSHYWLLRNKCDGKMRPPSEFFQSIPAKLEQVCLKCIALEPESRYQSAGQLQHDLAEFLAGNTSQILSPAALPKKSIKVAPGLSMAAILVVLAMILAVWPASGSGAVFNDLVDGGIYFDGDDDCVSISDLMYDGQSPVTIEAWVKPTAGARQTVFTFSSLLSLELAGGVPVAVARPEDETYFRQNGESRLELGEWAHLAMTYDGREIVLFVDGQVQSGGSEILKWNETIGDYEYSLQALPPFELHSLNPEVGTVVGAERSGEFHDMRWAFEGVIDELRISRGTRYREQFEPVRVSEDDSEVIALFHFDSASKDPEQGQFVTNEANQRYQATIVRESVR